MCMSYEHESGIRRQLRKNIVDSVYIVSKVIKEVWKDRRRNQRTSTTDD